MIFEISGPTSVSGIACSPDGRSLVILRRDDDDPEAAPSPESLIDVATGNVITDDALIGDWQRVAP